MQNTTQMFNIWQTTLSNISFSLLDKFLSFIPQLVSAFLVFFVGLIIAGWVKTLSLKIFQLIRLDNLTHDKRIKVILKETNITKLGEALAILLRWLTLIIFLITSLNILGLTTISNLLTHILSYIPNIISAVVVLTLGILLAGVLENIVKGALTSLDLHTARLMGKVTSYLTIVLTILIAISELHIAQNFINILLIGFVTTLSLGFGLALGLGSKDLVAQLLQDWYQNFHQSTNQSSPRSKKLSSPQAK